MNDYEIVSRDEIERFGNAHGSSPSRWNAAIEAALSNPSDAVQMNGITGKDRNSLWSVKNSGRYAGKFTASSRRDGDGTWTVFISAVSS